MSLSARMSRIEQRLSAIEQKVMGHEQGLTELVQALEQEENEAEEQPTTSLDGEQFERTGQAESLDG